MKAKTLKNLLVLLLLSFSISCSQSDQDFTITCNIEGLADGAVFELVPGATHKAESSIAVATASNGKLIFKGTLEEPRLLIIIPQGENTLGRIAVFAEAGKIKISAKATVLEENNRIRYNFSDLNIEGSEIHLTYLEKTAPAAMFDKMHADYNEKGREIMEAVNQARSTNNVELLQELYQSEAYLNHLQEDKKFFTTVAQTIETMILDNADSWWGPFLMLDKMTFFGDGQKLWWEQLTLEARESYYGKLVHDELFPEGFLGKTAPEFSFANEYSKAATLKSLSAGKKYTLIDFWASWCAPCRKEIPNFKRAYELFAPKGFELIGISIDQSAEDWKAALEKENLPWPNFLDRENVATLYKVRLVPSTFLVDENGYIIAENLKGEALIQKLEELLN